MLKELMVDIYATGDIALQVLRLSHFKFEFVWFL